MLVDTCQNPHVRLSCDHLLQQTSHRLIIIDVFAAMAIYTQGHPLLYEIGKLFLRFIINEPRKKLFD